MRIQLCALVAAIGLFATAFAEDTQPAAPPAVPSTTSPTSVTDPVICRVLEPQTGSRLGARKVCMRKSIWDQQKQDSGDDLERLQKGATLKNPQA
jgi:hypothetical protein